MQIGFAARGVLNKLNEKFSKMNFLFAEFYDFDQGIDPYFKRRLSQVPMELRGKDWVSIMWSRDPQQLSYINRKFQFATNISDLYATKNDVRFIFCSIVFTYISNSISYLEKFEKEFFNYVPDGFSTTFDNTPYKEWNAQQQVKTGYIRLAHRYNGYLYKCTKSGITGMQEPTWTLDEKIIDGSTEWTPVQPDKLKVQFENVAYSGLEKYSLDENDTLCKLSIGGRMFLPIILGDLDPETGELIDPEAQNYPRILYPRGDISTKGDYSNYEEYVTPTPEYWRNKLGF